MKHKKENETMIFFDEYGFTAILQPKDTASITYTFMFNKVDNISYDTMANMLNIGLISGEEISLVEVEEDDYKKIYYAYRLRSA